jgi:hypothetical protein
MLGSATWTAESAMSGAGTETLSRAELRAAAASVGRFHRAVPDATIAVALGTISWLVRRHVPADGLFYDDAWQAFGAWKGSLSEFVSVGQTQPGFTLGLMAWTKLFGISTASLVTPALIAGTLGPPALYAGLRWLDFSRSTALVAGAALVNAQVHIQYSYHVKTYTFDVLIVLGLALAVWKLAPRHWGAKTAVAWLIGSVVVGSFSSIVLVASSVAGLILVFHPSGDRKVRTIAVAVQLVVLAALLVASSRTYSDDHIRGFFAPRGGFIDFDPNPLAFGREVFNHFSHVADVFPGGYPTLSLVVAVTGLVMAACRGRLAVPARFLALMVLVAAAGSVVKLIPFGPPRGTGRVSLWLVPVMALGLCTTLEFVRKRAAARVPLRVAFDTAACIVAALVLVSSFRTDHRYPPGARSAIRQVMAETDADDVVVATWPTVFSLALYADSPVNVHFTPERSVGFLPTFADQRLYTHTWATTSEELGLAVDDADRVYLVHANLPVTSGMTKYLFNLAVELELRGFALQSTTTVDTGTIYVWTRESLSTTDQSVPGHEMDSG